MKITKICKKKDIFLNSQIVVRRKNKIYFSIKLVNAQLNVVHLIIHTIE